MRREAIVAAITVVTLAAACSPPAVRAADVDSVVDLHKPLLDDLVRRVEQTKHTIHDRFRDWQAAERIAELANDELGLPPYPQLVPPGPGYQQPPNALIGMGLYARHKAAQLEAAGDSAQLASVLADLRRRYVVGIIKVSHHLDLVERWVADPTRPFEND